MLKPFFKSPDTLECGLDEAGRGCLAGGVYAAAVILPKGFHNELLNDSKKLTDKQRRSLRVVIEENALAFAVVEVNNEEIDRINILNASILAMNRAVEKLKIKPELLLVDGNRFNTKLDIPFKTVVKGDATFMSIAAASVLAKTYRDDAMIELDKTYPEYNWKKNKGYPTKDHRQAIKDCGITQLHRKTFNLLGEPSLFD